MSNITFKRTIITLSLLSYFLMGLVFLIQGRWAFVNFFDGGDAETFILLSIFLSILSLLCYLAYLRKKNESIGLAVVAIFGAAMPLCFVFLFLFKMSTTP